MKPRPVGHGSLCPAHAYWVIPSTFCCDWSGSQVNCETRTLPPTGTAPAAVPASLYAWSETSMQVFASPTCCGRIEGSFGHVSWRSEEETETAPPGPAATEGWNWSVVAEFGASFTVCTGDHVRPPSV